VLYIEFVSHRFLRASVDVLRAPSAPFVVGLLAVLACRPAEPPRPNILFISIDTLRADHLGTYGYKRPTSPRIDEFAKTAVVFEQAHSSASWTLPSLTSLMTSLYTSTHGMRKNESRLDPSFHTLAELLRNAGYDTAMVASHYFLAVTYGLQKGFTHVDSHLLQMNMIEGITSPDITEQGVEWIREKAAVRDGMPWFLWLHYFDPHDAYLSHPGYSEKFGMKEEIDLYDGEIAFTDDYVGRVLDELKRSGLDDDTIVVVVADHGEEFFEHGCMRHGNNLYEETVRVPFMIRAPGFHPTRVEPVIATVDLMPTLLELVRVPIGHPIEGKSLVPMLRGERVPDREAVSEVYWHDKQDMKSLRRGVWKYIDHRFDTQKLDLMFLLPFDPGECEDQSLADEKLTADFHDELARRLARAREMSKPYGQSEASPLTAADAARMKALGYTGDEKSEDSKAGEHK
jgi:arylsulfatase A-like enzyme